MVSKSSSSDVSAPNAIREPISDDDLIRGFLLALGAVPLGLLFEMLLALAIQSNQSH